MGRYDFVSAGAAGGNAIQDFLMKRALQQRQQMLDQLAVQKQQQDEQQAKAELELRTGQERRIADAQKATMEDLANQREFGRATTIAENALPGDAADEATRALLEKQGYGGQLKKVPGVVAQGAFKGNDAQDIPQYDVTTSPDTFQMRGGSKYLAARTAAEERAAESEKARTSREEQNAATRASQEWMKRLTLASQQGNQALSDELKRVQIELAQDKLDAGKQTRTDQKGAVASTRSQVRDLAQGLLTDPNLDAITGPIAGRTADIRPDSVDVAKRLDQLLGMLSLESRGKMKGQGQISDFEGRLLSNSVSAIDRKAGAANVKKHLQDIIDAMQGDAPTSGPGSNTANPGTSGGSSFRVVGKR